MVTVESAMIATVNDSDLDHTSGTCKAGQQPGWAQLEAMIETLTGRGRETVTEKQPRRPGQAARMWARRAGRMSFVSTQWQLRPGRPGAPSQALRHWQCQVGPRSIPGQVTVTWEPEVELDDHHDPTAPVAIQVHGAEPHGNRPSRRWVLQPATLRLSQSKMLNLNSSFFGSTS